ncbi:MAG: transposase [Candidatus Riflebacteria bacterium]|mgnify:CR=1 FL=1|nr:transposase [Candidatus Riflebacteria bacterium]
MSKRYSKQFKEDALLYVQEHPDLSISQCARNLGINENTFRTWLRLERERGEVHRGSGNFSSDEAKENARLKREVQDLQDALRILKKAIGILNN